MRRTPGPRDTRESRGSWERAIEGNYGWFNQRVMKEEEAIARPKAQIQSAPRPGATSHVECEFWRERSGETALSEDGPAARIAVIPGTDARPHSELIRRRYCQTSWESNGIARHQRASCWTDWERLTGVSQNHDARVYICHTWFYWFGHNKSEKLAEIYDFQN